MKIAFTGAQSTGKSTLISKLKSLNEFQEYLVVDNIARFLYHKGLPINDTSDTFNATQLLIMNKHLEYLLLNKNLLCSRCLLDGLCYTDHLWSENKVDSWVFSYAFQITSEYLSTYDCIFYLKPEFALVNDGIRSNSEVFRQEVAKKFDKWVQTFNSRNGNIIGISGSINERLKQVLAKLDTRKES